jgi:hypothetical protein
MVDLVPVRFSQECKIDLGKIAVEKKIELRSLGVGDVETFTDHSIIMRSGTVSTAGLKGCNRRSFRTSISSRRFTVDLQRCYQIGLTGSRPRWL